MADCKWYCLYALYASLNNPEPITELAPCPDPARSISEERAGRIERGQVGERGERPARE